ncbi:hypothetical protein [Thermosulfuriphilus sp.]
MKREEIELILNQLMEKGEIIGYEIPLRDRDVGVRILIPKESPGLRERLKILLPGVNFSLEITGPIEAL